MWEILTPYRDLTNVSLILRLVLAMVVGSVIGMERTYKNHPAGLRTHMLVCIGSALVMSTNQYISEYFEVGDPSRLGAQVISGIGFLGAGTIILTDQFKVRGLTTAAGLWTSACTGLAIGIGYYEGAIVAAIFMFFILTVFKQINNKFMMNSRFIDLYMTFDSYKHMQGFLKNMRESGFQVMDLQTNKEVTRLHEGVTFTVTLEYARRFSHADYIEQVSQSDGLLYVEEG